MSVSEMVFLARLLAANTAGTGLINGSTILSLAAAFAALVGAYLTYRASTKANASNDRKVDLEEFRDQQARYKDMIETQEKYSDRLRTQIDRLNTQMDSLQQQLARETDVSNALRDQVRALQGQVSLLQRMSDASVTKGFEAR